MSFPRITAIAFAAIIAALGFFGIVNGVVSVLASVPYAKILEVPSMVVASPVAFFILSAAVLAVSIALNYEQNDMRFVFNLDLNCYSWEQFRKSLAELKPYALRAAISTALPTVTTFVLFQYCSREVQSGLVGCTVFAVAFMSLGWTLWMAGTVLYTLANKAHSVPGNQRRRKAREARTAQLKTS